MTFSKITLISTCLALALAGQNAAMALYWKLVQDRGPGWADYGRATSAIRLVWPASVTVTLIVLAGLWLLARTITPSLREPLSVRV